MLWIKNRKLHRSIPRSVLYLIMIDLLAITLQLLLHLPQAVGHLLAFLVRLLLLILGRLQQDHSRFHFGQLRFMNTVLILSLIVIGERVIWLMLRRKKTFYLTLLRLYHFSRARGKEGNVRWSASLNAIQLTKKTTPQNRWMVSV